MLKYRRLPGAETARSLRFSGLLSGLIFVVTKQWVGCVVSVEGDVLILLRVEYMQGWLW